MTAVHKLTNLDISEQYRDAEIYMMRKDFTGQFARWVVEQSPYEVPDIAEALKAFNDYVTSIMAGSSVRKFSYAELNDLISEAELEKIPAVLALNVAKKGKAEVVFVTRYSQPHPDYDFIDLGALARNIFYSIIRHHANWPSVSEEANG